MKKLQINPPKGYEIDKYKSTFTNIVFKKMPKSIQISAEQKMEEIWKSCNNVKYSSDNCRTYFKDNKPMFQQDWNNKKLYYNHSLVYLIFEEEYNMQKTDINQLIITVLSKDLNCNNLMSQSFFDLMF